MTRITVCLSTESVILEMRKGNKQGPNCGEGLFSQFSPKLHPQRNSKNKAKKAKESEKKVTISFMISHSCYKRI